MSMDRRLEETILSIKKCNLHSRECDYEDGLNENVDGTDIDLCGYHGADYLAWKLDGDRGGVRKYIEWKAEELKREDR